jgi:hypothetical protein
MNVLKNFSKTARRSLVRAVVAGAVIGASGLLALSSSGAAAPPWRFGTWGNEGHEALGDCPEGAGANLVRNLFPTAPITTAQVENYYRNDSSLGGLGILEGYGYGGHRIDGYTPVTTRAQFIAGANHGGLYAIVWSGEHAVAVIGASTHGVTFVSWGIVWNVTWSQWKTTWSPVSEDSLQWAPAGQTTIMYEPNYGELNPTFQVASVGSTVTLAPPTLSNPTDGVTFEGWTDNPLDTGTLLRAGSSFQFTGNTVMYAVWTA